MDFSERISKIMERTLKRGLNEKGNNAHDGEENTEIRINKMCSSVHQNNKYFERQTPKN